VRLETEPDRDPADIPAGGAARVLVVRSADGWLRVDGAAFEAADAREHGKPAGRVRGSFHTHEDPGGGKNSRRASRLARAADVGLDLFHELRLGGEGRLVPQPLPQLDDEPASV
jgi:hypothetical protein